MLRLKYAPLGRCDHQLLEAFGWYAEEAITGAIAELQFEEGSIGKIGGGSEQCGLDRLARHRISHEDHFRSHAMAIQGHGAWVPGVIDPACLGSSQVDGRTLMEIYTGLGLKLTLAVNAVEAGIAEVWRLLVSGQLKVMASCTNWFREFRKYHRDDKGSGKIVKRDDHLMDATRYLVIIGRKMICTEPQPPPQDYRKKGNWMY